MSSPSRSGNAIIRILSKPERRLQIAALLVALLVVVSVFALRGYVSSFRDVGYLGVFFLSFFGAFSMVLPVPGLITLCGVSLFLNPIILGILSGVGEGIGEVSGYAVGYGGGSIVEDRAFYKKLKRLMERRGVLMLFIVSAIPNPIFDFVGIAAGGVRFPIKKFIATVMAGKIIKGLLVSHTCYYGITALPWVN